MTAGNYVITGCLNRLAAAGENGCCGFTYFLESSCCCCVIVGLLPWYSQAFDQMFSAFNSTSLDIVYLLSCCFWGCALLTSHNFSGIIKQSVVNAIVSNEGMTMHTDYIISKA